MTQASFALLLALGFCHFIADYPFSTKVMVAAKAKGSPFDPILCHATVHTVLMMSVLAGFKVASKPLGIAVVLQLVSHTVIDVLKGKCNVWFPAVTNPAHKPYWNLFGFDQFLHFVVIAIMVYIAGV